jgi:uncharacterized protein YqeY
VSVKERVNEDLRTAMKARDKDRTSVLRMMLSELKYAQAAISMSAELGDEDATKVIASYHKRLAKSLDDYPEGERRDAIRKELVIVEDYLPKKAGVEEVTKIVDAVIAGATDKTFGPLMKEVMARLGSSADGKVVSQLLKQRLANS